jgi:hypothetical protein
MGSSVSIFSFLPSFHLPFHSFQASSFEETTARGLNCYFARHFPEASKYFERVILAANAYCVPTAAYYWGRSFYESKLPESDRETVFAHFEQIAAQTKDSNEATYHLALRYFQMGLTGCRYDYKLLGRVPNSIRFIWLDKDNRCVVCKLFPSQHPGGLLSCLADS